MWHHWKFFERFQQLNLKHNFLKTKTVLKRLEYRFLFECTTIENATFRYKTVLSKANIKRMEWGVQNGPFKENGIFPLTTLFFFEI